MEALEPSPSTGAPGPEQGRGKGCGQGACLRGEVTQDSWARVGAQVLSLHEVGEGWGVTGAGLALGPRAGASQGTGNLGP